MKTRMMLVLVMLSLLGGWQTGVEGQVVPLVGKGAITQIAYSPDGTLLAVADDSARVWLYETPTLTAVGVLQGHTKGVEAVAFSPDGKLLASGSTDKTVRLWEVAQRGEVAVLKGHTSIVKGVAFSPDGTLLASGGAGRRTIRSVSGMSPSGRR
jgi:WD40 repeat protein